MHLRESIAPLPGLLLVMLPGLLSCYQVSYPSQFACSSEASACPPGYQCNGKLCTPLSVDARADRSRDQARDGTTMDESLSADRSKIIDAVEATVHLDVPFPLPDLGSCSTWEFWSCSKGITSHGAWGQAQCHDRELSCEVAVSPLRWVCNCTIGTGGPIACGSVNITVGDGCDACTKALVDGCCPQ